MVVLVDLEDENSEPPDISRMGITRQPWTQRNNGRGGGHGDWRDFHEGGFGSGGNELKAQPVVDERANLNKSAMTEAMACYPIVISLSSHLDLNDLDSLSITCRQIRANLLQYRSQLLSCTLHCENEDVELNPEHTFRYRARAADWYFVEQGRDVRDVGKVGACARDMVNECRRCGKVICRNCTIKPPAHVLLKHRHRRICSACFRAPLSVLASATSTPLLKHALCACPAGVYLCQPCGRSLRSSDSEYEAIWKWRTRYLPSLGGLGVGIGEGNRGVPCERGAECLAAREVEKEVDCDAEDARDAYSPSSSGSNISTPVSSPPRSSGAGFGSVGPGYLRHEIEGIGGVVKKKLVTMEKVGACVSEWGEEKEQGLFLIREQEGRARSWCGWCWRVIPSKKDLAELAEE